MTPISGLVALALGLGLVSQAWGQEAAAPAGAGAAAAVSGAAATEAPAAGDAGSGTAADAPAVLANGMDVSPATQENGRWYNAEGIPTFKVEDGVVDFATFNGYRRYHAECHVCHGPDGEGSTYAPALKDSVLRIDYYEFQQVVASGKQGTNSVMPAFGTNKNVWCYIDDIYVYLLAHGTGEIPRGRPAQREDKSEEYTAQEDSCMSM